MVHFQVLTAKLSRTLERYLRREYKSTDVELTRINFPEIFVCLGKILTDNNLLSGELFRVSVYFGDRKYVSVGKGCALLLSGSRGNERNEIIFETGHPEYEKRVIISQTTGSQKQYIKTYSKTIKDGDLLQTGDNSRYDVIKLNDGVLVWFGVADRGRSVSPTAPTIPSHPVPPKKIFGYTDGACKVNPGRGGWGWVEYFMGISKTPNKSLENKNNYGGSKYTTNNQMELQAMIEYIIHILKNHDNASFTIFSDSMYVLQGLCKLQNGSCMFNAINGWLVGWKAKNFKNIKNPDVWEMLYGLVDLLITVSSKRGLTVKFEHVKGHSGEPGNERADQLANIGVGMG